MGTTANLDACYRALGLNEAPFRITPDTQFFFPHSQYLSALGHLRFGMMSGGFTVMTAEVGLGKTLLCRHLLRNLPEGVRTAYVYNPQLSFLELMRSIIHDLGEDVPEGESEAALQQHMLEILVKLTSADTRVAVLVDEAHRLSPEVLEGLRLLSNLETEKQKLLSLLLVGQPELETQLKSRNMRALRERISVWHRLHPFDFKETESYINHRLDSVRTNGHLKFTRAALWFIHYHSRGVPRRINLICDRALLAAYVGKTLVVTAPMARRAAREVLGFADQG
ncbi:MAG: AAA family ATPase [Actinomycetota bacterium]|nr:AAA family ATPase [Actinomycetota bacterium]MDZ4202958.1 AAA family ATPase [Gallionella sp.]